MSSGDMAANEREAVRFQPIAGAGRNSEIMRHSKKTHSVGEVAATTQGATEGPVEENRYSPNAETALPIQTENHGAKLNVKSKTDFDRLQHAQVTEALVGREFEALSAVGYAGKKPVRWKKRPMVCAGRRISSVT